VLFARVSWRRKSSRREEWGASLADFRPQDTRANNTLSEPDGRLDLPEKKRTHARNTIKKHILEVGDRGIERQELSISQYFAATFINSIRFLTQDFTFV